MSPVTVWRIVLLSLTAFWIGVVALAWKAAA